MRSTNRSGNILSTMSELLARLSNHGGVSYQFKQVPASCKSCETTLPWSSKQQLGDPKVLFLELPSPGSE
ncbi:hypothetical protein BX616_000212 [Lobosporangium transversale]|nr:hypothetical protein BX616_000212 [Lobosporangium transversale]